jgi:transposase InsO family protein
MATKDLDLIEQTLRNWVEAADEDRLYLAIVLDLFNREVAGWQLKPRMTADIVTGALTMARFRRKPEVDSWPIAQQKEKPLA